MEIDPRMRPIVTEAWAWPEFGLYMKWIIGGFVLAHVAALAIGFLAVFTVDQERFIRLTKEGLTAGMLEGRADIFEERFGECVALTSQWLRQETQWLDAIESRWVRPGPENLHPCDMLKILLGLAPPMTLRPPELTFQYPFGFRYLIVLGLGRVNTIAELKHLYKLASYGAVILLLYVAWRSAPPIAPIFLPIPLVLLFGFGMHGYAYNIAHAPAFITIFVVLTLMIGLRRWFEPLWRRLGTLAALGALNYYLDISYSIPFALSLVLVVNHLFFVPRGSTRAAIVQGIAVLACLAGSFLVAVIVRYLLMLGLHGIGSATWLAMAGLRLGSLVDHRPITFLDVAAKLYAWLPQLTGGSATATGLLALSGLAWITALGSLVLNRRWDLFLDLAVLVVASAGVLAWYRLFLNHTYVHAFFMVRIAALPIAYGFVAALSAARGSPEGVACSVGGPGRGAAVNLRHTMTRGLYRRYRACARYFLGRPATPLTFAFFRLLRVANRLASHRRLTPSQVEANRVWKALYFTRYGTTPPYRLEGDRPIAIDSADHQWPRGTILNSSVNQRFNLKLYDYFRRKPDLRTLDIGCAGGGFVRSLLEDGYEAVGVEGSDISQRLRSGEWDTIPYHLFTADAAAPFSVVDRTGQRVLFDCITAWEVLEHIPEARLGGFLANIATNLAPSGIFVGSIALFPDGDPLTGAVYHVTLHEPSWWLERFWVAGLEPVQHHPFQTEDYVRGHGRGLQDWDPVDGDGVHVVMRRRDENRR